MRVLQINGVIHSGSTGAIVDAIDRYLEEKGVEYTVAYGIGPEVADGKKFCYRYEQAFNRRISMLTGFRYGFAPLATRRLLGIVDECRPDIVHLHSINGNCLNIFDLLEHLKKNHIATVVTNHADFFYTGNCTSALGCEGYVSGCTNCRQLKWATDQAVFPLPHRSWMKMKEAFDGFEQLTVVSVSDYSKECSMRSPILSQYPHKVIFNGVDTSIFSPRHDIDIREKYGLKGKRIGLLVTSWFSLDRDHLKGGYWLTELASLFSREDFEFLVVGSDQAEVDQDNIVFAGKVNDRALLANIYSQCDVSLSFSKAESFGMTCAEALCCGTPFVGFFCGGIESIALSEFSRFVKNGDIEGMKKEMIGLIDKCEGRSEEISECARAVYSSEEMAGRYFRLYNEIASNREVHN